MKVKNSCKTAVGFLVAAVLVPLIGLSQTRNAHASPPTRPVDAPGAPQFTLTGTEPGTNAPADQNGNFVIGPNYAPAPELVVRDLIAEAEPKPIRIWMLVGDADLLNPNVMRDGMHDWVVANHRMAAVLSDKGYDYQYVYALNSGHCSREVRNQALPQAIEWVWRE